MSQEVSWDTKNHRGAKPEKLVDYILLAEFDIDSGSTLRHQYPSEIPDYKPDWFAEHMLPEGAHNRDTDYTYIFLNRDGYHIDSDNWIKPKSAMNSDEKNNESNASKPFLYGLNFVKTKHDATVRRGAILKALCVFSRYSFIEAFKKPLELTLEDYFNNPSAVILKNLFDSLNSISIENLPYPNYVEQLLMRRGVSYDSLRKVPNDYLPASWNKSINGRFNDYRLYLTVPVYRTPDEVGDISVSNLVKVFGEAVMRIYHAVLTKQRVLFVGYNHAASDISQMVLSAVALVCPPMTDLIRRTFPYSTLSDLGFLEVPGYIAGVTNPMFQQHESWWDLLCVLDLPNAAGYIYSAEERKNEDGKSSNASATAGSAFALPPSSTKLNLSAAEEMPHYIADAKFIQTVLSGINSRINEEWVRQQFYDYTATIVGHAQDKNMLLNAGKLQEKSRKFLESNLHRINQLDQVSEFRQLPKHYWIWVKDEKERSSSNGTETNNEANATNLERKASSTTLANTEQVDGILLKTYLRKLLNETGLDTKSEVVEFYKHFLKHLTTEASLQVLLIMLPDSQGGLVYFAAGLLHSSPSVRYATTIILQRLKSFPSTKAAFDTLNAFLLTSYERQLQKIETGELQKEMKQEEEFGIFEATEEPIPHIAMNSSSSNFEEITAVLSSATSDISHVVDEASTVVTSFLQHTLEFMNNPNGSPSHHHPEDPSSLQSPYSESTHDDNISPLDLMP